MDSIYNEVLSELKDLLKYNDHDSMAGWYQDGSRIIWKRDYESFFERHLESQFLDYALEQAKGLVLDCGRDFVSTALERASAAEILALSTELEFDQQWGRDAYTAFCGKKTKRAHHLGFKAFEILRYACEIAYTGAAAEASAEMGVEAY